MKVFNKDFPHQVGLVLFIFSALCGNLSPVVVNNFVDPVPVFTVRGSTISLLPKKLEEQSSLFSFNISPYTQITKSCYNDQSAEVASLGARVGPWGMGAMGLGLIANYSPNANSSTFTSVYGDVTKFPTFWSQTKDKYASLLSVNYPKRTYLYYDVDFEYEKVGIRSELACEPAEGFVVSLQGGICDHKAGNPMFYDPTTPGLPYVEGSGQNDTTVAAFMTTLWRELYLSELNMDAKGYQSMELDDITFQLAAYYPVLGTEEDVRLVPRATVGVIIPGDSILKKKKLSTDKDNVLQELLPVGNEGFTGFFVEGAACLDFKNTVNMTVAAGYTIFKERAIADHRIPNNQYQCILYPFTQNVTKKRGDTWYLSASMYAQDFIEGMQAYIDYSWTVHRRDTITLDVAANLPIFKEGLPVLERLSEFRVGTANFGLVYKLAKNIEAGASVQVVLHGFQVFKPYTFMGSLSIVF